jgi:hypothetical protein
MTELSKGGKAPLQFLPTGGKKKLFFCGNCKRDITQQLRIHCAICEDFDLCGDCFSVGASRYPHVNTHDYRVIDCLETPLFTRDWTISEELLLLEGDISIVLHALLSLIRYSITIFACDVVLEFLLGYFAGIEKCGAGNWKLVSDYIGSKNAKQVSTELNPVEVVEPRCLFSWDNSTSSTHHMA